MVSPSRRASIVVWSLRYQRALSWLMRASWTMSRVACMVSSAKPSACALPRARRTRSKGKDQKVAGKLALQEADGAGIDWPRRVVGTAIGPAPRDHAFQPVRQRVGRRQGDARRQSALGIRQQGDVGGEAGPRRGDRDILQRAAEPDEHLALERIHRAELAAEIGVQQDFVRARRKAPGLRIMRTGGERCGRDQPADSQVTAIFERRPRRERRIGGRAQQALPVRAIENAKENAKGGESDTHRSPHEKLKHHRP